MAAGAATLDPIFAVRLGLAMALKSLPLRGRSNFEGWSRDVR